MKQIITIEWYKKGSTKPFPIERCSSIESALGFLKALNDTTWGKDYEKAVLKVTEETTYCWQTEATTKFGPIVLKEGK